MTRQKLQRFAIDALAYVPILTVVGAAFLLIYGLLSIGGQDGPRAKGLELLVAVLTFLVAAFQLYVMRRQLEVARAQDLIMRQQNEILLRRAELDVYDEEDTTGVSDREFPAGRPGILSSMSRRFHISNSGTRGAHGFTLTVCVDEALNLVRDVGWTARREPMRTYFIYNTEKPVYPNSIISVPVLTVFKTDNSPGQMLNAARAQVAHDDGISPWAQPASVRTFSYAE
jgi:hypothetical protein